jgi:hypothetical protein
MSFKLNHFFKTKFDQPVLAALQYFINSVRLFVSFSTSKNGVQTFWILNPCRNRLRRMAGDVGGRQNAGRYKSGWRYRYKKLPVASVRNARRRY